MGGNSILAIHQVPIGIIAIVGNIQCSGKLIPPAGAFRALHTNETQRKLKWHRKRWRQILTEVRRVSTMKVVSTGPTCLLPLLVNHYAELGTAIRLERAVVRDGSRRTSMKSTLSPGWCSPSTVSGDDWYAS